QESAGQESAGQKSRQEKGRKEVTAPYLFTTVRQRSNSSSNASAYSSADRLAGLPGNPAAASPFPQPVVTAMNFVSSRAISSLVLAGGAGGVTVSWVSSSMLLVFL